SRGSLLPDLTRATARAIAARARNGAWVASSRQTSGAVNSTPVTSCRRQQRWTPGKMSEAHPGQRGEMAGDGLGREGLAALRPPLADERDHPDQRVRIDGRRLSIVPRTSELLREDGAHAIGEVVHQPGHLATPLEGRRVPQQHREAFGTLLHVVQEREGRPLEPL